MCDPLKSFFWGSIACPDKNHNKKISLGKAKIPIKFRLPVINIRKKGEREKEESFGRQREKNESWGTSTRFANLFWMNFRLCCELLRLEIIKLKELNAEWFSKVHIPSFWELGAVQKLWLIINCWLICLHFRICKEFVDSLHPHSKSHAVIYDRSQKPSSSGSDLVWRCFFNIFFVALPIAFFCFF